VTTNQSAEPHGTYLVLGLLIAAGAVMFLWLAPRNQDPDPETAQASEAATNEFAPNAAAEPKPAPAEVKAAAAAEPTPAPQPAPAPAAEAQKANEPVDLFAQPLPEELDRIHKRVANNQWLSSKDQKALYDYGKEHKDDARPQLMLAWDARNREWDGIAARMYRIAFGADQRAKDDPSMLPDLISIASRFDNVEFTESASLIADAYGAQALPEIEDEISLADRRGEQRRLARLNHLRDQIRSR
jgi:type IV secretory pathway VirB10-like protein